MRELKPMSMKKFIKKKNKLLKKYTGVTLVPKNQIEECKKNKLSMDLDSSACPYCREFICMDYPMKKKGNGCNESDNSTYRQVVIKLGMNITEKDAPWHKKLSKLVDKFNESNNFIGNKNETIRFE